MTLVATHSTNNYLDGFEMAFGGFLMQEFDFRGIFDRLRFSPSQLASTAFGFSRFESHQKSRKATGEPLCRFPDVVCGSSVRLEHSDTTVTEFFEIPCLGLSTSFSVVTTTRLA